LGKTVQVVPHITDSIQEWIERVAKIPVDDSGEEPDICIGMFSNKSRREAGIY
jgi:CTP synthase